MFLFRIAKHYNIPHILIKDVIETVKNSNSPVGQEVAKFLAARFEEMKEELKA